MRSKNSAIKIHCSCVRWAFVKTNHKAVHKYESEFVKACFIKMLFYSLSSHSLLITTQHGYSLAIQDYNSWKNDLYTVAFKFKSCWVSTAKGGLIGKFIISSSENFKASIELILAFYSQEQTVCHTLTSPRSFLVTNMTSFQKLYTLLSTLLLIYPLHSVVLIDMSPL